MKEFKKVFELVQAIEEKTDRVKLHKWDYGKYPYIHDRDANLLVAEVDAVSYWHNIYIKHLTNIWLGEQDVLITGLKTKKSSKRFEKAFKKIRRVYLIASKDKEFYPLNNKIIGETLFITGVIHPLWVRE
jgi:hypothetical protein